MVISIKIEINLAPLWLLQHGVAVFHVLSFSAIILQTQASTVCSFAAVKSMSGWHWTCACLTWLILDAFYTYVSTALVAESHSEYGFILNTDSFICWLINIDIATATSLHFSNVQFSHYKFTIITYMHVASALLVYPLKWTSTFSSTRIIAFKVDIEIQHYLFCNSPLRGHENHEHLPIPVWSGHCNSVQYQYLILASWSGHN